MDLGVISVRYARALLKSATEQGIETTVFAEMQSLGRCFIDLPQLRSTIDNPMLSAKQKETLLLTACGDNVTALTQRFFQLVLKEGRENALQFMAASYVTLYRKQKNITCSKLITATNVSTQMEEKMKRMVENNTHGTVEFQTEVDPDIVGGFILEYDTYRLDASVKTKLRKILTALK